MAPTLTLLHPPARAGEEVPPEDLTALLDLYDGPPAVTASMITTVDGAATGADQVTGSINGPADLRVFTALRTLADVVLVGAGTVRKEGYRAPRLAPERVAARVARGMPPQPDLAVVTASGTLPEALLTDRPAPWVFTTSPSDAVAAAIPADRLVATTDLTEVVATLRAAGARRIVTEGGPTLLGGLIAAGLVDEVCLTIAPLLVGGPALRITDTAWFDPAVDLELVHLLGADSVLLGRWRVRRG